jgi:hypothetical protein
MVSPEDIKKLLKESKVSISSEKNSKILDAALFVYDKTQEEKSFHYEPSIWSFISWRKAGCLVAIFLIISSWMLCFVLYRKVTNLREELARRDVAITHNDDSATINFYLREHQDVIARKASMNPVSEKVLQMRVRRHDIIYYEIFDDQPEYMNPGIIVKGPSFDREITSPDDPAISNGHRLTLSEAREAADFNLVSPPWLDPGYMLDQIRRIEGRDALHLLYTDGINTLSLFEQPLDGLHGLEPKDLREYAVYRNTEQAGRTILAWGDDTLSYFLIGNAEMPQLMNMAQSISASK